MPLTGKKTEIIEEGTKKEALSVSFTNGALQQLEELKKFIGSDDPIEVIKVGIAFIQTRKLLKSREKITKTILGQN